jgi:dTMP kinase
MAARGKFVVLEGIDGSGKRTQLEMLARAFDERSIPYQLASFPNYSRFFGKLAGQFLNGDFGSLESVDPHLSALIYASDRWDAKPSLEAALAAGKLLLADRYIGSNMAHQGARVALEKRAEFIEWLRQLEYEEYGLPVEDLVIYLRVPVEEAHRLIGEKSARNYTNMMRDLQESSRTHLADAASVYEELSQQPNWMKIDCVDANGAMRTPVSIQEEILAAISARVLSTAQAVR